MAQDLTPRRRAILAYLIEHIQALGYPPTIAELGAHFGIASTNGVNDHLVALEKHGYIERCSKARGIRITEKAAVGLYRNQVGTVPLVGRVAAGAPILAEQNIADHIPVSAELAKRNAFALRVRGDSMIEAGIFDGDLMIIDQERTARKGDIVVALVEEEEATVKYYYPNGRHIELRPANSSLEPMHYSADQVQIQGVAVSLQRLLK